MDLTPQDAQFEQRVRDSFYRQGLTAHLGMRLESVEPGRVVVSLPFRPELTQQHGYFHGGVIATVADNAGGYAAYTLTPPGASMVSIEFKLNTFTPAIGERLVAEGQVVRAGRKVSVSETRVYSESAGQRKLVALMIITTMTLLDRTEPSR